jgi:hypothetical protein
MMTVTSGAGIIDSSDTVSSADSALGLDVGCLSSTEQQRHHSFSHRHHRVDDVARCLEDCEALFDDDEMSRQLRDDASSFVSTLDETGLLSPTSSYSSRDDCSDVSQHRFELHSVFWHERFQSLLRRWEARQASVSTALLPARVRYTVPYLVQFAELRCLWEDHQRSSTTPEKDVVMVTTCKQSASGPSADVDQLKQKSDSKTVI